MKSSSLLVEILVSSFFGVYMVIASTIMLCVSSFVVGLGTMSLRYESGEVTTKHKCSWNKWESLDADTRKRTCDECGETEVEEGEHVHIWDKWVCYTNSDKMYRHCDVCGIRQTSKFLKDQ